MRHLRRSCTFDDLEEATSISEEVNRIIFHKFITYGKEVLYRRYVKYPTTDFEGKTHMKEFEVAVFHGVVGSMDKVHITIEKCSRRLKKSSWW